MAKKIFYSVLTLLLVMVMTIPMSALESLTVEEAEELIVAVNDFYAYVTKEIEIEQNSSPTFIDQNVYVAVTDIKTTTYSELLERAKGVFTEEVASKMILETNFLFVANGQLHFAQFAPQFFPYSVDKSPTGFPFEYDIEIKTTRDSSMISFNFIEIEGIDHKNDYTVRRSTLIAKYVNGKWRISGGEYIDILCRFGTQWGDKWESIFSHYSAPQTGNDISLLFAAAIASASVAAIAKRRAVHRF